MKEVRVVLDFSVDGGVSIVAPLGPNRPYAVFCGDEERGIPRKSQILIRLGEGHCFVIDIKQLQFTRGEMVSIDDDRCDSYDTPPPHIRCVNRKPCAEHPVAPSNAELCNAIDAALNEQVVRKPPYPRPELPRE